MRRIIPENGILHIPQLDCLTHALVILSLILGVRQHNVGCSTEGRRYYATLLSLLGNRGRIVSSMDTLSTRYYRVA
jgi:hypothetical protein